jgi:chemotaxis protein methyltransferase CheR
MEKHVFEQFCSLVYEKSGIAINGNKIALVNARIGKRVRELGLRDDREYLDLVTGDPDGDEIVHMLDVISTNVTSFFRESAHFDFLGSTVAQWYGQGQRRFRFWSAASSTGEEPYSLAMTLTNAVGNGAADMKILATDISTRVLAQCKTGRYVPQKMAGVPESLLQRFFSLRNEGGCSVYEIKDELRKLVSFTRLNLSKPPFPMQGPLDAIFCRNVMIYFDNIVRKALLEECYRLLKPEGYLFVGHAESLTGILSGFKAIMPSVYVKPK